jgi:RNA recognition motif-containing protein
MSTQQRLERAWSPFMLYLGNLPYSMGDHELANICSHHGNLSDLFVVTDKFSGRSKGFAFAKFAEDKAAVAARAALDGLEMDGRQIHVSFARDPDRERRSAQPTPVVVDYGLALVDGALEPVEVQSDGQRNVAEGWQTDHVYLYIIESGRAARLRDELEELVYLVSNPATREEELQALFEQHRWLLLGTQYKDLHPKVRLERGEAGPLIPDFVLEPSVPPAYG